MSEKQIQEKKLNVFQRIRKYFYLRNINEKKALQYGKLPDYLKSDIEVIDAVVQENKDLINEMSNGNIERLISANPTLIQHIDSVEIVAQVIDKVPDAVKYINNENYIYNLVNSSALNVDKSFIKHLSPEMQIKLICGDVQYKNYSTGIDTFISKGSIGFENFSDEVIEQYILSETKKIKSIKDYKVDERSFSSLRPEIQKKFLKLWNGYASKVSPEVLLEYVGDNPLLFDLLPEEIKVEKLKQNPELFKKLSKDEKYKYNEELPNIAKKDVPSYEYNPIMFDIEEFSSPEELKNYFISMRYRKSWDIISFDKFKGWNDEFIWEVAKFDPSILKSNKNDFKVIQLLYEKSKIDGNNSYISKWFEQKIDIELGKKIDTIPEELTNYSPAILELVKNQDFDKLRTVLSSNLLEKIQNNSELIDLLQQEGSSPEEIFSLFKKLYDKSFNNSINMLSKFLTNDDIMEKISQESIIEYIENPTHDKLVEIVEKTYGKESAQILKDRPRIKIQDIPNMYIFHPEIINEFSIGAVHATLSYEMNASSEFSELARNPEKMKEYKEFSRLTKGLFDDTAVDLDKKLVMFEHSRKLLSNIKGIELTDAQIDSLKLAINDYSNYKEQNVISFPSTIEELSNYRSSRSKIYDEAIAKLSDPIQIKNAISQRFFGMNYSDDRKGSRDLNDLNIVDMCRFYQLGKFINRKETLESGIFSEEELDALEVLDIIMSVNDPNILKEISAELSEKEMLINPIVYQQLKQKVPKQYSKDFVDKLMSPQQLEEAIKQGKQGIRMRIEDGIKIITLDGIEFYGYVTNPFMNNSGLNVNNYFPATLAKNWNEMENGISTISGCPISSEQPKSTIGDITNRIGCGFSTIDPMQIIVMSPDDAGVTHATKKLEISATNVEFDYIGDLNKKTKERIDENGVSLNSHGYGEVASLRVERNLSKISSGTHGGRINLDYIYAYGNGAGTEGIEYAKAFGLEYIIEYNPEPYNNIEQVKKDEKKEPPKKEKSNFIKGIRKKMGEDGHGER